MWAGLILTTVSAKYLLFLGKEPEELSVLSRISALVSGRSQSVLRGGKAGTAWLQVKSHVFPVASGRCSPFFTRFFFRKRKTIIIVHIAHGIIVRVR